MNVVIFGGSFNPIHIGHKEGAEYIFRLPEVDKVWITPCLCHRFGKNLTGTPIAHRIKMCDIAFEDNPNIETSDVEALYQLDGSTYNLILRLLEDYPAYNFSIVIGQDNADEIEKWHEHEKLLSLVSCLVLPRGKGFPKRDWYLKEPHLFLRGFPKMNISSSNLRTLLPDMETASKFLPNGVSEYIIEQRLYR